MLQPFQLPFVQQGIVEILLLAGGAGILGVWIVLRGLSFYAHGVATATFPGLVLASGLGFAAPLGALAVALGFAGAVGRLATGDQHRDHSTVTAMVLVGALAGGVLLASNVFPTAVNVNALLFGSLLVISDRDLLLAGVVSLVVLLASLTLGRRWLAIGFDRTAARAAGIPTGGPDAVLLVLVALIAVAALSAVGALLTVSLLVVPAATVRPWVARVPRWQLLTVLLTALQGTAGLWLSAQTNAPPGATIAVLTGMMFTASVLLRALSHRRPGLPGSPGRRAGTAVAVLALAAVGLTGCGSSTSNNASATQVPVVVTTSQLGDIVREVGGDAVSVHQILAPSTDPHEYEPRPKDITQTASAQIVFASGLGLDEWIGDVVKQSGSDVPVVTLGDDLPVRLPGEEQHSESADADAHEHHDDEQHDDEDHHDHDHGAVDPHWWHNPQNVEATVIAIRDALIRAKPADAPQLKRSAAAYLAKLKTLDAGIQRCVTSVPKRQRKLVTSHDAFDYFADRYKITVVGAVIPSQTTQAQPSAADVSRLARLIRQEDVKAIFPESSVNPKLAQALGRETGVVSNLTLYGDTLGESGSDGDTYLKMEQHNADAVLRGFTGNRKGCTIPGL